MADERPEEILADSGSSQPHMRMISAAAWLAALLAVALALLVGWRAWQGLPPLPFGAPGGPALAQQPARLS
ncbi:MAG: hypothetical protein ACKOC5_18760, partial [Chloroflexota bacterium]